MDCRTGHIVADVTQLEPERRQHYTQLPEDGPVNRAARRALRDGLVEEATVPLGGRSELAKFARRVNSKAKRKGAKASRKRNRGR